jgi:hypothetical protein
MRTEQTKALAGKETLCNGATNGSSFKWIGASSEFIDEHKRIISGVSKNISHFFAFIHEGSLILSTRKQARIYQLLIHIVNVR